MSIDKTKLRMVVEKAVEEALIAQIVQEVIRLYRARPVSCALLFCGERRDFPGLDRSLFDVQSTLGEESELLVLPDLTINAAAKIAHGIADEPVPLAASHALLAGKPVIACTDNAGPAIQGAYGQMLRENLNRLRSFGIQLVPAADLRETLLAQRQRLRGEMMAQKQPAATTTCQDKLVTWQSLSGATQGGTVQIRGDAIVTPLALDYARTHAIKLIKKEGSS